MNPQETPTSTTSSVDGEKSTKIVFSLMDLPGLYFTSLLSGWLVSVDDCSDADFHMFIQQYVKLKGEGWATWTAEERRDVLNFIFDHDGPKPVFNEVG